MNDRELLELAAKAEGRALGVYFGDGEGFEAPFFGTWNPLEDDGDALRLAVKLRINLEHTAVCGRGRPEQTDRVQASPKGRGHMAYVEMYANDELAATRHAVVCAAAEIGREM